MKGNIVMIGCDGMATENGYATKKELRSEVRDVRDRLESIDGTLKRQATTLEAQGKILKRHDDNFKIVIERLDGHSKRFDEMDKRFDGVDGRLDGIDKKFDGIDKKLAEISNKLDKR